MALVSLAAALVAATFSGAVRAGSVTVMSNASTLGAALGPGGPSTATQQQLDAGNDAGLVYTPVVPNISGSFTAVPPGAPAGTQVVNIAPGDGESGFYKVTFTLPSSFTAPMLQGSANVDDVGRAFLNGNPISPSIFSGGPGLITEYNNAVFSTSNASFFLPGQNVLLIADANTGGGPSAGAFYANIVFDGTPLPSPVPEPAGLTLAGLAGVGCLVRAWRRRCAA
jgi:hypothetical protein